MTSSRTPHQRPTRTRLSTLAALASMMLTITAVGAVNAAPQASPTGPAKPTSFSAQAVLSSAPDKGFVVRGQPHKLAAAMAALEACKQGRSSTSAAGGYCELTRLNGVPITTAAAIKARVPETPHPLFLWRYTNGDTTLYLGGSVHILKPGLKPPRQYQQAFEQAQFLGLEVDLSAYDEQQLQQITMGYALMADGQTLPEVLPPATYSALNTITAQYGLPLAQLARFKPAFITQQLAVMALMSVGYNAQLGVEQQFTNRAQDKQILQLETLEFQLDLLLNQPMHVQTTLATEMLGQMQMFEPLTADLLVAWLSGDDAAFTAAFDAQTGTSEEAITFMHQLMDERNIGMADKISGYLTQPGKYFILIGAAHYIGENSIIRLLEAKGFKGERIYSNDQL